MGPCRIPGAAAPSAGHIQELQVVVGAGGTDTRAHTGTGGSGHGHLFTPTGGSGRGHVRVHLHGKLRAQTCVHLARGAGTCVHTLREAQAQLCHPRLHVTGFPNISWEGGGGESRLFSPRAYITGFGPRKSERWKGPSGMAPSPAAPSAAWSGTGDQPMAGLRELEPQGTPRPGLDGDSSAQSLPLRVAVRDDAL